MLFKHIVITRYAVGKLSREWLEDRLVLFKTYCLPTVAGQSVQDFNWYLYLDAETPPDYLLRLRELVAPYPNFLVKAVPDFTTQKMAVELATEVEGESPWVLTTRLDNDDGWHRDYIKRLHAAVPDALKHNERRFINFPVGLISYRNRVYLYRHSSNAFISCLEPSHSIKSVICLPHEKLPTIAPIDQLDPRPAFLQVVHGANVSNKPRGVRVHKTLALEGFEAIPELFFRTYDEDDNGILLENLANVFRWGARDAAVKMAKAMLGKR